MAYKPHEVGTEVLYLPEADKYAAVSFYGEGTKPVVFLHGAGENPTRYHKLIEAILSDLPEAQIVAIYAPGTAESSPAEPGEAIGDLAAHALEAAGVTGTGVDDVTVFGHSHGGWAGAALAEKYPDLRVGTAGTPVGEIPSTGKLVGDLLKDEIRNNVADAMYGKPAQILELTGKLATAQAHQLTHPTEARERLRIIQGQMAQISTPDAVETRRQLMESGQLTPAYFKEDNAVLPPNGDSIILPGTHMAPVNGPVKPVAEFVVNLAHRAA